MPLASAQPAERGAVRHPVTAKRLLLAAATAFLTVNVWIGCPLLALWVGSQAVGKQTLSMFAVGVVVVVLAALVFTCAVALVKVNAAYDRLIGRPSRERRLTWLRPLGDAKNWRDELDGKVGITVLEWVVMVNVWVADVALLIWFFAFAGSPLPHG